MSNPEKPTTSDPSPDSALTLEKQLADKGSETAALRAEVERLRAIGARLIESITERVPAKIDPSMEGPDEAFSMCIVCGETGSADADPCALPHNPELPCGELARALAPPAAPAISPLEQQLSKDERVPTISRDELRALLEKGAKSAEELGRSLRATFRAHPDDLVLDSCHGSPPSEKSSPSLAAPEWLREALQLLGELHALVKGECPSLLNEDSGGDAALDIRIAAALASPSATPPSDAGSREAAQAVLGDTHCGSFGGESCSHCAALANLRAALLRAPARPRVDDLPKLPHAYVPHQVWKHDRCEAAIDEGGRRRTCAEPRARHMTAEEIEAATNEGGSHVD
jgi:hypothetical protein